MIDINEMLKNISFPVRFCKKGLEIRDSNNKQIADLRGWGWLQYRYMDPDNAKIHDLMGEFIADAMNNHFNSLNKKR
jgi:hypothetical protein